ncbi:unnamed protein product [Ectocarpus fasciculatus]
MVDCGCGRRGTFSKENTFLFAGEDLLLGSMCDHVTTTFSRSAYVGSRLFWTSFFTRFDTCDGLFFLDASSSLTGVRREEGHTITGVSVWASAVVLTLFSRRFPSSTISSNL